MESIGVVTSRSLSKEEIVNFVVSAGGYWNDEPTLNQGVIEKESARIFIDGETDISNACYEHDRLEYACSQLGAVAHTYVAIHIGHGEGSKELAFKIAREMITLWGGLVDDDHGNLIRPGQLTPG